MWLYLRRLGVSDLDLLPNATKLCEGLAVANPPPKSTTIIYFSKALDGAIATYSVYFNFSNGKDYWEIIVVDSLFLLL